MKCKLAVAKRPVPSGLLTAVVANALPIPSERQLLNHKGETMHTTGQMIFRRIYVTFRDRHVQILRMFIFLCCFAALGFVLFGRNVAAIILIVVIGSAGMLRFETCRRF